MAESSTTPEAFPELPQTRLGVLLFTDVVGSTDLKKPENLGGPAYQRLLERHNQLFENGLDEIPGSRAIKHTGDGYFAEFPTASVAVRFALLFQSRMSLEQWGPVPLTTRVGIYVGEYQVVTQAGQEDIVGRTADLAARLMSLAVGGQILLTRQAFDDARQYITAIAGLPKVLWLNHGPYLPKGGEPLDVCEVGFEGAAPLRPPESSEKVRRVLPEGEHEMFGPGYPRPSAGLPLPDHPDWILTEKLGEGGFGEVWLGENRKLAEKRVFKFCFNAKRLRSLQREFALFRLVKGALGDRDDIARLHDYRLPADGSDTPPPYYLVSEYAAGGSLDKWAAALPGPPKGLASLSETYKLDLLARVTDAVAAAHSIGIRHKDIKPANILLRHPPAAPETVAKTGLHPILSDFGIGFLADTTELDRLKITNPGFESRTELADPGSSRTGTRLYAAPELLEGHTFTTHADVFALGVLLYQLLISNLDKPLTPEWRDDIADEVLRETIAAATTRRADARPSATALAAMIRGIPARREQLTAERTAAEQAKAAQVAAEAREAALRAEAQRQADLARRRKRLVTVAAILLITLLLGILGTTLGFLGQKRLATDLAAQKTEAERQRNEAESQRAEADKQRATAEANAKEATAQRDEAKKQEAIAHAVAKFQTDMLATADPDKLLGDKVTVLQAMTAAQRELDAGSLKDQPLVETFVRSAIGNTLLGLARYDEAAVNLRRALEIGRQTLPAGHPDIATSLTNLAYLLQSQNKLAEAEPLFREALEIRRQALPAGHADIAISLNSLADLLRAQNKLAEAEPLYREALEIDRKALPAGHPNIALGLNGLASLLRDQNKLAEAEPLYREALAICRESLPAGHPYIAHSLTGLAVLLWNQSKLAEAEPLYREALEIYRQALPAGHPDIATSLDNLALLLRGQNKLAEAEPLIREALEIRLKALPAGHPSIATTLNNLAGLLQAQNKLADAEPVYREALAIREKSFGPIDARTCRVAFFLAETLDGLHRPDEAAAVRTRYRLGDPATRPTTAPTTRP